MPELSGPILDRALRDSGMSTGDLWLRYVGLGGTAMPAEIDEYRRGEGVLDSAQGDILAHALNERFLELGQNHPVRYPSD